MRLAMCHRIFYVRADGFNSKLQMLPEHNIVIVCTYSSGGQ